LTAETRNRIRTLIDQHRRAELEQRRKAYPGQTCTGCGCDLDNYTTSCKHCSNRRWRRYRRELAAEAERLRLLRRNGICRCGRDMKTTEPVAKRDCARCWDRQRFRHRNGGKARQSAGGE